MSNTSHIRLTPGVSDATGPPAEPHESLVVELAKIYAPYEVVDLITRRNELLLDLRSDHVPIVEGVLEGLLQLVNDDLMAIQPEDVNYNLPLPGTT